MTANLTIDPDLQELIPPLEDGELARLEASIRRDGCMDALKVWRDGDETILLDGHNRHGICERLGLPYRVEAVESVTNRYEAIQWMIDLQLSRRNLTPERQSYLRGRKYNEEKCESAFDSGTSGNPGGKPKAEGGNSYHPQKTSEKLAIEYGVSEKTIRIDATFAAAVDALPSEERMAVLGGKSPLTKKQIIRNYRIATGQISPPDTAAAAREKDYQIATRKALATIDDVLATYGRDIQVEVIQSVLSYLHHNTHVNVSDVERIWSEIRKGGRKHD